MSVVNVAKQTVPGFVSGNGTIGTTEGLISDLNLPVSKAIVVKAHPNNSGTISIGNPGNAAAGFVLAAGEVSTFVVESLDKLAIVANEAGQLFSWFKV